MTVRQLRELLHGVPDGVFVIAHIPDMLMRPEDLTLRMEAPLTIGNPGYTHVVIEPIEGKR